MATIVTEGINPSNPASAVAAPRKRIPMSVPQRKLETSPIPGYHQYWFLESRVARALQGGYEFVDSGETTMNDLSLGGGTNAHLGSRVMIVAGTGANGQPEHLVLMKIKEEWYTEDQKLIEAQNRKILDAIRKRPVLADGERPDDADKRYIKTADLKTNLTRRS